MGDAQVAVRLLGPVEVDVAGAPADLGGPRQRAVLTLLLVARGEVVSVDRLIDDLWRGEPPPRATGALQAYVSNLRRALEPSRSPRTPSTRLVSAPPGYAVRFADDEVDAWRVETLVRRAAGSPDAAAAVRELEAALACWRGPALAEYAAEAWATPEAARLDDLRLVVRERLVDAQVRGGWAAEAVLGAEALTREAPLREEGWRLLALGQYVAGRQADALATLRRARDLLATELGIDPGPRLAELEQAVLTQTVALPRSGVTVTADVPVVETAPAPHRPTPLVGREAEAAALLAAADSALPGRPSVALVAGEAGGGKSTVLSHVGEHLQATGWRVVVGRCPESEGGPAATAWAQALRAVAAEHDPGAFAEVLAPLLSDSAVARPGAAEDAIVGRYRLHRAVAEWLSTAVDRPLAILLDDVHRADSETRALISSLCDHGPASRILLVAAYRPESTEEVDDLLARVAPYDPTRVRLTGLDRAAAAALIEEVTGRVPEPAVVETLARRTDGNPFYLKESARLLASEGALVATSQVPEGVRDVLRRRLSRLPEETVSVLRLASVLGRDVDVALIVGAAEVPEDAVLDALEAGVISGLLVEPSPGAVRFSHLLVRETLYSGIAQLRRVRWHARVAAAVAALYPDDLASLAHHSVQAATPATALTAAAHAVAAAGLAESRYAYDSAAELLRQALRCLDLATEPVDAATRVGVLAPLLRVLVLGGATEPALEVRRQALDLAQGSGSDDLLMSVLNAWNVPTPWLARSYRQVDDHLVAAVEDLLTRSALTVDQRCLLLCVLVRETYGSGRPRTDEAADEAVALARSAGDPFLLAMALAARLAEFGRVVDGGEREPLARELVTLAQARDLPALEVLGRLVLAQTAAGRPDIAEAYAQNEAGLTLAERYQMTQAAFAGHMVRALLAHVEGRFDDAERMYAAACDENRRVGGVDADGIWIMSVLTLRVSQGRLAETLPMLRELHASYGPAAAEALALALCEVGRRDEARDLLLAKGTDFPRDFFWALFMTMRGLAVAAVGDPDMAAETYDLLMPLRHQLGGAGTSAFTLGPVAGALARLAHLMGREDDAAHHAREAVEVARRTGSAAWIRTAEADLERFAPDASRSQVGH